MHIVHKGGWGLAKFVLINKLKVRSLSVQGGRGPNTSIFGRKYYKDFPKFNIPKNPHLGEFDQDE